MLITQKSLKKIPQLKAIEILNRYQQEKSFREIVNADMTPVDLMNWMEQEKRFNELVIFLCHSLQPMEAIWWGYLCISPQVSELPEHEKKAMGVINQWLHEPIETYRRMAEIAVKRVELDNASGWLAQAVFWSGGSITPVNGPESPAPPYLYSHAVAGAICLAAVLPDGQQGEKRYRQYIDVGIEIANGGNGR
ncbi:hypothetical protein ACH42_10260 [Endozoicomonas sp. (ex Bugula neritina AB1)]|nr:hypothetical protein ACH42_10260 [Endozoicomonas sp. (ex Bugula neritina AB1)]